MDSVYYDRWRIDREDPAPLFQQLVNNIKCSITTGEIKDGYRLPPIREMAAGLGVSPDTVRNAYSALADQELVVSRRHHGTCIRLPDKEDSIEDTGAPDSGSSVSGTPASGPKTLPDRFEHLITDFSDLMQNERYQRCSEEDLRNAFESALQRILSHKPKLTALFVESGISDTEKFGRQLSEALGIQVDPLPVVDLEQFLPVLELNPERYQIILTTYFYYADVSAAFRKFGVPIYGIITDMKASTRNYLLSCSSDTKLGIVCKKGHSMQYYTNLLRNIRGDLQIRTAYFEDTDALNALIQWSDAFFVTRPCEQPIMVQVPEKPIYFFYDQINPQSIDLLREYLKSLSPASENGEPV